MERHRLLVVGVGSIGERHLRCFQQTGRVEVSFVEINPRLLETIAVRYGVTRAFGDLGQALVQPPDVAVIATPAPSHLELATTLAEAGVHVLIEKPLGIDLDGIDPLKRALAARGRVSGVAYVYRCHPLLAAMRDAIAGGRFGRPVQLVAVAGQHFPTYRPAYRTTYYTDRATGGGAIQDALTHLLNAGEWLVGPIDRLVADAAHLVLDGVAVEDTAHVLARHGEVLASYTLNQHQAPNEVTVSVNCERGTARCEFHRHRWRWMVEPGGDWQDEVIAPLDRDTVFINQAHLFLDAVEGKRLPVCTLDEGIHTLRVNLAALTSLESRSWQVIMPW
ncbi:MAG: Gfo/Idh/MocA family oxidoreductase [Isosphaeraceae bacterium]